MSAAACAAPTEEDDTGDEALTTEGEEGSTSALSSSDFHEPSMSPDDRQEILDRYSNLDPNHVIDRSLLNKAILYFDTNKDHITNKKFITVVDFSKPSGKDRFFIVDMATGKVEPHVVAHGSGSDPSNSGIAKRFSNAEGSNMSSLGYVLTGETYDGKHGNSLRLDGLSTTNSNMRARAVVIHGAAYVSEGRSVQGRSWGCFALPENAKDAVISKLKGGSLIYAGQEG